ncbi:MAG: hypothetical protein HY788_03475 [Deltaproteobacteria bacterium]|nr:hypothetical protein [Deltaproteobacteria bacterium]
MRSTRTISFGRILLVIALVVCIPGISSAATYNLTAKVMIMNMPEGGPAVTMWAYALDGGTATVPGPVLVVPPGDDTLIINLTNELPVPTSLLIRGQMKSPLDPAVPVWTDGLTDAVLSTGSRPAGNVTGRVRSFDKETAPTTTVTYTWSGVKMGTYLYGSGTNMAVQGQMGLYGALKKDAGPLNAYGAPATAYDDETIMLFHEVDPVIHGHVAADTYGPGKTLTSTIDYHPTYFLINGEAFTDVAPLILDSLVAGSRALLRFLNAGLETHIPLIYGMYMSQVAEDGIPLNYPLQTYLLTLAPGKTMDAILQTTSDVTGDIPVFDRRLFLTNDGSSLSGGMMGYLTICVEDPTGLVNDLADFDGDGDADGEDLVAFFAAYNAALPSADLNGDTLVNDADVIVFANNFGTFIPTVCP